MWTALTVVAVCGGLCAFGAVMYRAGRKSAQNQALKEREKENAKVDKIVAAYASLSRDECLERLRGAQK